MDIFIMCLNQKVYFIFGMFLITTNPLFSQNNKIDYGIRAGLNYSSFVNDSDQGFPTNYEGKIGFQVGGLMKLNLSKRISFQSELLLSNQNSDFIVDMGNNHPDSPLNFPNIEGTIKEFMIALPITLNYSFNEKIDIHIGPKIGYEIISTVEYKNAEMEGGFLKLTSDSKFEVGAIIDLGYYFGTKIRTGIRYSHGITKRIDANSSVFSIGIDYKI